MDFMISFKIFFITDFDEYKTEIIRTEQFKN